MTVERFFRSQLIFKTSCAHGPDDPCPICGYGRLLAEVASEFLARSDFENNAIERWADEVDRRRVEKGITYTAMNEAWGIPLTPRDGEEKL